MTQSGNWLEYISTGNSELDAILGGGWPKASVNVIAGGPGTGKSILTLSQMFHHARQGKRALYFTTVSEPAIKIFRYMQQFAFFDQNLVDDKVFFFDLGSAARSGGIDNALEVCVQQMEEKTPDLVAIDSFKALHDLLPSREYARAFVYDLAVNLTAWGATSFLVGEYSLEDIGHYPEFFVADGILYLAVERDGLRASRQLEALKTRGAAAIGGRHFFDITSEGLRVYPRVHVPQGPADGRVEIRPDARVPVGVPGIDEMLSGGLPSESNTLLEGGTGTGKTLISLSFLVEGARRGEPGVFFTLEESRDQIFNLAAKRGWDFNDLEERGLLRVVYTSPVELAGDALLYEARQLIAKIGAKRAVIDSLSALGLGIATEGRFRELVYALVKTFEAMGVTAVVTNEIPELLGNAALTGHGVSSMADNIILLRYVEIDGDLRRAIAVLKMRGSAHERQLREMEITSNELRVAGPFADYQGVLTGVPARRR